MRRRGHRPLPQAARPAHPHRQHGAGRGRQGQRILLCAERRENFLHGRESGSHGQFAQPHHRPAVGNHRPSGCGRQLQHPAGLGRRVLPRQPLLRAVRSIRPAGVAGLHGRLRQHLSDVGDGRGVHAGSHLQPEAAAPSRLPRPAVRQQRDGKRRHQLGFPGQPAGAGRLHPPVRPSAAGAVRDLRAGHLLLAVQSLLRRRF